MTIVELLDIVAGTLIALVLLVAFIAITHWVFTRGGSGRRGRRR